MIHVISKYNRHLYDNVLDEMFKLRHDIFVGERGWRKLEQPDGRERDQFDTDDTIYFLKLDPDMRVLGGMRLYPTTVETQLNTIFRDTCVLEQQPVHPDHWEWSRYFIAEPRYRSATGKPVHYELYTGILEYALAAGIKSLSGFIETGIFVQSGKMPWDMRQLGIPFEYGGTDGEPVGYGLPIQLMIDRDMVRKTKIAWRMVKPCLSLSLGEEGPYREVGFKPAVILEMQDFMRRHPQHIDAVMLMAQVMHGPDPEQREHAIQAMQDLSRTTLMEGFNQDLTSRMAYSELSMMAQ